MTARVGVGGVYKRASWYIGAGGQWTWGKVWIGSGGVWKRGDTITRLDDAHVHFSNPGAIAATVRWSLGPKFFNGPGPSASEAYGPNSGLTSTILYKYFSDDQLVENYEFRVTYLSGNFTPSLQMQASGAPSPSNIPFNTWRTFSNQTTYRLLITSPTSPTVYRNGICLVEIRHIATQLTVARATINLEINTTA